MSISTKGLTMTTVYEKLTFDEERALYGIQNSVIENCIVESRDTLRANTVYQGTPDEIKIVSEKNFRYAL